MHSENGNEMNELEKRERDTGHGNILGGRFCKYVDQGELQVAKRRSNKFNRK